MLHANSQSGRLEVSQHSRSSGGVSVRSWWSAFSLSNTTPSESITNDNDVEKWDEVGKLKYNRKKMLGQGCSGTAVYECVLSFM